VANIIRIKRSSVAGNPSTLAAGELAYSALTEDGSPNGGDRLYIGIGAETGGNAANHFVIGGKYFTDMMDHTRGTLTASSAILVDSDSKIDQIKVGNMTFIGSTNTIISANSNANLNLTPNGTGSVVASKLYVTGTTTFNDNVVPTGNGVVNLGTATNRFGTIYLSGSTIELGTQSLTSNAGGVQLTGNLTTSTLTANIADGTAPLVITSTTRVANLNVATAGNLVNGTSNVVVTNNGNITVGSAGNAAVLTVTGTGTKISGNLDVSSNISNTNVIFANTFTSNVSTGTAPLVVTSTTRVANLNVANAGYADSAGTASSATTAGTVTTASQPNITSVGTLAGVTVTGNANVANLNVSGKSNLNSVSNVTITGGTSGQFLQTDGAGNLSFASFTVEAGSSIVNGTSNVSVALNGNITVGSAGNAAILTVTGTGANIAGYLTVTGQSNLNAVGNVKITGGSSGQFLQTDGAGNLSFASISTSSIVNGTSNVSVALNGNITIGAAGNAAVVTVSGSGANINGTANVTGNAYVANIFAGGFFYSNGSAFTSDSANLVNGTSNVKTGASGNVTVSVAGNANVLTVTGTGIVAGNANIGNLSFSDSEISSTITNHDISLNPNGTGNVNVNNSYITNLHEPFNDSDAATKLYVDTVAQGLHIHVPANVATQANLATITGGSVTYDNGTSGVGATLTLGTAITAIDGVTYPTTGKFTSGARIIVKDEANAHYNGIYTINAGGTVLTRATDFDTVAEVHGGDFIFVQYGSLYASTGWVQNQDTVTIGGSDIDFLQFAGAGSYSAGTGLTLNGTEFSISSSYVGQTSITTLGNVTTGTWSANVVGYAYGGTGQSSYAKGDIVYASATNTLAKLTAATNGQVLQLSSGVPVWGDLDGGTYS